MNKIRTSLFLSLFLTSLAGAQAIQYGTREFGVSGMIDPSTAAGVDINLDASYGYFPYDDVEVLFVGGLLHNDFISTIDLGIRGEYHWLIPASPAVPYAGVGAKVAYSDVDISDDQSFTFGMDLDGGVKYFINDTVALTTRLVLDWATDDIFINDDDVEAYDIRLEMGLRFYF